MTEGTPAPLRATEQLPIAFFESVVLAARTPDGAIHLALRDLCEALGLALPAQRRRIQADEALRLTPIRVLAGRQFRTLDFLLLEDVPIWITEIQSSRVSPETRERFRYIKSYLISAVVAAFAQLTGLPEGPSQQIEDLHELDRLNAAFAGLDQLAERQSSIEASQDRARLAFRELAALVQQLQGRVQVLEQQARQRLSPGQRGAIYQLVQAWGAAQAERRAGQKPGEAIRACWRLFNERFGIGTYTDLPAARYDEAVQFVKQQYQALTGRAIDAAEQAGMELE